MRKTEIKILKLRLIKGLIDKRSDESIDGEIDAFADKWITDKND